MRDLIKLAQECEDALIWNITVSSHSYILEMSRKQPCSKGLVHLTLPRSLDLEFEPELEKAVFETGIEQEVFVLRDFFGIVYLLEILPENALRISHCNVGTMFSITAKQSVESPSDSWQLIEAPELELPVYEPPTYDKHIIVVQPSDYLKELEGMRLERIVFRIDASLLHFKKGTEERILQINSEIEFKGNLSKKFELLLGKFPDEKIGARMSLLAGCIDSEVYSVELIQSGDLAITFNSGSRFAVANRAPEANPYFEDSWSLQDAITQRWLVVCTPWNGIN